MRLTRKRAIDLSIELWEWLAETGKQKNDWPRWEDFGGFDNKGWIKIEFGCFLCEKYRDDNENCANCPYYKKYSWCFDSNTPFRNWEAIGHKKTRKKYARELLEQLKELKK